MKAKNEQLNLPGIVAAIKPDAGDGFKYSRLFDALQRHLLAWNDGEDIDPESGLSHLYHASCMLMFLAENDDRYHEAERKITELVDRGKL